MGKVAVSIIQVELDESVPNIISAEITSLSEQSLQQLQILRETSAAAAKHQEQKVGGNRLAQDAIQHLLKDVADRLLTAGDAGIPAGEIMGLVRPFITTTPAFTLRMKTYLRAGGDQYEIGRVRNNYILKRRATEP